MSIPDDNLLVNLRNDKLDNTWKDMMPDVPDTSLAAAAHDMIDKHNWTTLLEDLADGYLAWKYQMEVPPTHDLESDGSGDMPNLDLTDTLNYDFDIDVVDIYTLDARGYLGTTPETPTLALSLWMLELYYRIWRWKPSSSIEAFAKVLCDLYIIPYCRHYQTRLSNTFDAYLQILHIVKKQVAKELGCDEVEQLAGVDNNGTNVLELSPDDSIKDPTDDVPSTTWIFCADNWKATATEFHKKMWAIFNESGIFASAC
ncbi:hypothetical protein C0993_007001 [Termitomyces sp. T159_Od127]|nr:hypothetical protein C0993_007001 [Termitomyces sp. T159_Od127]